MQTLTKTRSDAEDNQMAKRLKLDNVNEQTMTEWKCNTTILEVNDDCLAEIFGYLSIRDLLSVRASNSRFKTSTESAYLRKKRALPTSVSNCDNSLQISIDFLKQFGHLINKLCVFFKMDKFELLMQAIVDHCGDTVTELVLCHKKEDWIFSLHRTAVRRTKRQMRELKTKFPKLISLSFEYYEWLDCPYSDDIIQAIPSLKTFNVQGLIFSDEDVYKFIALNGQLEKLSIWVDNGYVTQCFFDRLDVSLPNLKEIELNRVTVEGAVVPMKNSMRFKNLRKVTFGRVTTSYLVNGLSSLFGEGIEELELYCDNYFISQFVTSISRFKKLSQLTLNLVVNLESITSGAFDASSFISPGAIQELILHNSQLKQIILSWCFRLDDFMSHGNQYRNIVKGKLNGVQWCVYQYETGAKAYSMNILLKIRD